jgi:2-polyprenyl-6-methoxyphenol hydroxylase-like FAD-dependent oxidoreductase
MEPPGTVGLHLVAGGYVGACRVEPGLANLCGLLPEAVSRRFRGDLDRLADAVFPGNPVLGRLWASARPVGAWKAVAGVRVESSRPALPGILYAGDCQGTIDPLGGQGMTMALLGAEMLAPFVARAFASPGRCADLSIQSAYHAAWHRRFDRRVRLCRAFHHALVNPWLIDAVSTLRTLAPRLLALGFTRTRDPRVSSTT